MNIAILLFGQPRFFNQTWPLIKEEFDFGPYNHNVEYFAHFWNKVGYVPLGSENDYNNEIIEVLKNEPKVRKFIIEDYSGDFTVSRQNDVVNKKGRTGGLDELCTSLLNYYNLIRFPIESDMDTLRYRFGQHYSIRQAFNLIKQYEQDYSNKKGTEFKYDIIIKIRTDLLYRPENCFKSEQLYFKYKNQYYTADLEPNLIKCNALRLLDLSDKMNNPEGKAATTHLSYYKDKTYIPLKAHECKEHVEAYPIRLCLNDWTLIAGRSAADIYYGKWFENFHLTTSKDIKLAKTRKKLISGSEHSLQGQFLLNYRDLQAGLNHMRRDVRLLHKDQIKPDVDINGKILLDENTTTQDLRDDITWHYRRK